MRLLTFSTLYPSPAAPNHGVFVENRLRHLLAYGAGTIQATVLAPLPWFPRRHPIAGTWGPQTPIAARETRAGIDILHPRYPSLPGIGMSIAPVLLYAAAHRALAALHREGARFDAIDAHYLYPTGVAACWLGRAFGLPVVLTARGSDVTELPEYRVPRALIRAACAQAAGIVTVSRGLADALVRLGVPDAHITVLRNGVDLAMFAPRDRQASRAAFAVPPKARLAVSVGGLIPRKGHDLTIAAMALLPDWHLLIAGEGPEREALLSLAQRLGVAGRVRLLGAVPHADLPALYSAADVSVLSSSREGWANVLLESMASGTPVVASPIPGNGEVVQGGASGLIAAARTGPAIAAAILAVQEAAPRREETAAYAARFGWDETSAGQVALFRRVIGQSKHGPRPDLDPTWR
jgi:glycosyltransferase involved in cell wall biosynthesis